MNKSFEHHLLDATQIIQTVEQLSVRIHERFPESGLQGVSKKLLHIVRQADEQARWIDKAFIPLRVGVGILIGLIILGLGITLFSLGTPIKDLNLFDFIQTLEAGINDIVLIAIAVFFLGTLERRIKRNRALKAIHELRAIAHIIDMHQLTKDPVRLHWESQGVVEPRQAMTPFQLTRYLDYCSEMLSLVGKTAVLYVQRFDDPVALSAVNEVENLTTGLSRKIWQKLMIIHNEPAIPESPMTAEKSGTEEDSE